MRLINNGLISQFLQRNCIKEILLFWCPPSSVHYMSRLCSWLATSVDECLFSTPHSVFLKQVSLFKGWHSHFSENNSVAYPEVSYLTCLGFLFLHLHIDVTIFEWPCYELFCPFPPNIPSLKLDNIPRLLQHPNWFIFLSFLPLAETCKYANIHTKVVFSKFYCFLRLHLHYLHHYHHYHTTTTLIPLVVLSYHQINQPEDLPSLQHTVTPLGDASSCCRLWFEHSQTVKIVYHLVHLGVNPFFAMPWISVCGRVMCCLLSLL